MTLNQINKSGFIKAFLLEYYEYWTHSVYPDIDRLNFILCKSPEEKENALLKEIEQTKVKIKSLGCDSLAFAYIQERRHGVQSDTIQKQFNFDFWINLFVEEFIENVHSFTFIKDKFYKFLKQYENRSKKDKTTKINEVEFDEIFHDFWLIYYGWQPTTDDVFLISEIESEIQNQIELEIDNYKKEKYWEFDFRFYEYLRPYSITLQRLMNVCDLWVHLERLEMFQTLQNQESQPPIIHQLNKTEFETVIASMNKCENLFWKGLPMSVVTNHFRVFAEKKAKNGVVFLSYSQLISFYKRGFLNDVAEPKQTINFSNGQKGFVLKRFYEFFEDAVTNHSDINNKEKYVELVDNCFVNLGATTSIMAYFKPNKTKQSW